MDARRIRELFPGAGDQVYLNTAAQCLLPTPVVERMHAVAQRLARRGVTAYTEDMELVETARAAAARLVGAEPSSIAFTANVTDGLTRIAEGLDWRAGDEVVLPAVEYPANVLPWAVQRHRDVALRFVEEVDGRVTAERLFAAAGPRTRVIAVSHVQFGSGERVDLSQLGAACRERGILLVVDAIQSAGVVPIDVAESAIGALAVDGRKWLLGPPGCGFVYLAADLLDRLRVTGAGLGSTDALDDPLAYRSWVAEDGRTLDLVAHRRPGAPRFEGGFPSTIGVAGLGQALLLAETIGHAAIHAHVAALVARIAWRAAAARASIHGPARPAERAGIVSLPLAPGIDAGEVFRILNAERYVVALRAGRLRVSPYLHNTIEEVDALMDRLEEMGVLAGGAGE